MQTENFEEDWDENPEDETEELTEEKEVRMRIEVGKKQESIRIDKYLMNHIEGATRSKIQQALEEGNILLNDAPVKSNYKVRPLDSILIFETRNPETSEIIPEELPLNIVFEDDDLLVIDKEAGMVVHPGAGNPRGTLVNGLAHYLSQKNEQETSLPRVGLVHRIDKFTSGLLVIGKNEKAMTALAAQFKKHTSQRRYVALAWGDFEEDNGTVEAHVGRNLRFRKMMDAFPDGEHGKHAVTHYSVLERFNYVTLLELQLETGRTHQIRVHMKHIGHPLFNDTTYGGDAIVKGTVFSKYKQFVDNCFKLLPRQALHAKELGFQHPTTGEWMQFTSEMPEEMVSVIERWRTYTTGMTSQLKAGLGGNIDF